MTATINFPRVILGTMTWGEQNTEQEARDQLDAAMDLGLTFIDTAELYPVMPKAETQGRTETYIGNWMRGRDRSKLTIASKVAGPGRPHLHNGKFSAATIREAVEGSLRRLQTDYIDLYQIHWPSRPVPCFGRRFFSPVPNPEAMPIEETLGVMADLIAEGKIRALGVSNETPWGVCEFSRLAREMNLPKIVSIQNPLSLIDRSFENGLDEACMHEDVSLIAYSPLGGGVLTGKYDRGEQGRFTRFPTNWSPRFIRPESREAARRYVALAERFGLTPVQMALGFVSTRWYCRSTIIGATSVRHLQENVAACYTKISPELEEEINKIHIEIRNPAQ